MLRYDLAVSTGYIEYVYELVYRIGWVSILDSAERFFVDLMFIDSKGGWIAWSLGILLIKQATKTKMQV